MWNKIEKFHRFICTSTIALAALYPSLFPDNWRARIFSALQLICWQKLNAQRSMSKQFTYPYDSADDPELIQGAALFLTGVAYKVTACLDLQSSDIL